MKALEIKSEIDKTQSRIAELETEREQQTATVEAAEKSYINGKADIAKLNDAQGKLSLYERTIESLRATYQRLKSAFESQSEVETRREQIKQMTAAANEVGPLVNNYLKTRDEFHEIVKGYAERLIAEGEMYRSKQAQYRQIVGELEPTAEEIQTTGLDQQTLTRAGATYFNHPPLEYGEPIQLAENLLAAKTNKAEQAKRAAAFREASAKAIHSNF